VLTRVDRVQIVVADRKATAARLFRLLGAEEARQDRIETLAARRHVLRLGASEVELLEPDGEGPVADFLRTTRGGLFSAGAATEDLDGVRHRLRQHAVDLIDCGGQLFLPQAGPGLRMVISTESAHAPVGLARRLYEVTNLVDDFAAASARLAAVFGLDSQHFVPIKSAEFGYEGVLTLFRPDQLDRIEIITPTDLAKTMGRFFQKRGPVLYMCYVEADDVGGVRERLLEHAPQDWTGPRSGAIDNLWIHHSALAGGMIGVSRTTHAWLWSGRPERVAPGKQ
jgi:hypothetical protein